MAELRCKLCGKPFEKDTGHEFLDVGVIKIETCPTIPVDKGWLLPKTMLGMAIAEALPHPKLIPDNVKFIITAEEK